MAWRLIHKQEPLVDDGSHWAEEVAITEAGFKDSTLHTVPNRPVGIVGTILADLVVVRSVLTGVSGTGQITIMLYMTDGPAQEEAWRVRGWNTGDNYGPHSATPNCVTQAKLYGINMFAHSGNTGGINMGLAGTEYKIRYTAGGDVDGVMKYWTEWYAQY